MGDQPVARTLPTHRTTQTQNKDTQTSKPRVGFEPTIPVFERVKTVQVLHREAAVIGTTQHMSTTTIDQFAANSKYAYLTIHLVDK
jgi:hypothetical protein